MEKYFFVNDTNTEKWKNIRYPDIDPTSYEVSNYGQVRNTETGVIIKGCNPEQNKGYVRLKLKFRDGKRKKVSLHRIIALTFMPISFELAETLEVNHKDGRKTNNRVCNLEWCTSKENIDHAFDTDLRGYGERIHNSKLTDDIVEEICRLMEEGLTNDEIVKLLNIEDVVIHPSYLSGIRTKSKWTHIANKFDIPSKSYRRYGNDEVEYICKLIVLGYSNREIADKLEGDEKSIWVIKDIRSKRRHKAISDLYF